jgi:hypothetical protein
MLVLRGNEIACRQTRFIRHSLLTALTSLAMLGRGSPQTPPQSTLFATAAEEAYSTVQIANGNGDLWPSCWADDDNLYTASGDGTAFYKSNAYHDIAVSKISGAISSLTGTSIARGVGTNWAGNGYDRKPTGMLCINSALYLAFQNLDSVNFNSAPAASIARSTDHGLTWTWNAAAPMFGGAGQTPLFTTVFFLDFGKNSSNAIDGFVYAYGLDNNWRSQQSLYRARVPGNGIQTRSAWQFYAGLDASTNPLWTADIAQKKPVLLDTRLLYPAMFGSDCPPNDSVIAQGGVVYDKPLNRYIFTSWSCSTHEIYEAPEPWGPWGHVLSNDFGPIRGIHNRGQYGTSIPSKFISADGKTLMLQSNVCCSGDSYTFSLRKVLLELSPRMAYASNTQSNANLALVPGTRAISKSTHFGSLCAANCSDQLSSGLLNVSEDDYDEEAKQLDWWGYQWPEPYNFDEVVYQTGNVFSDGGWFAGNLQVQILQNGQWVPVPGAVAVTPAYPYSGASGAQATFTFDFPSVSASGVRISGIPGGASHFSAISQLGAYYGGRNLVANPGFEAQATTSLISPWSAEGPDTHGVEVNSGTSHSGTDNGVITSSSTSWNALTQTLNVNPGTDYILTAWVQNTFGTNQAGAIGVRAANGVTVLSQAAFGSASTYIPLTVKFNSGSSATVTLFAGFKGGGSRLSMRLDDVALR